MGDKLNKLIKEVGLKEEYYTYFKDSDVIKVIVYDDNEQYDFIISNKFILPLSVYNELLLCLKKCFNNVRLYIDVKDIDYSLVTEYFSSILKDIALDMAKYNVFLDRNITLVDKTLRIDAYNKVECTNLITIKNDIINKLKCYGFKDIDIDINLSLDGNKELINQIENEKVVEYTPSYNMNTASSKKEEVTKSTYRAKKSSEVTEIKDIMYEVDNININWECYMLGKLDTLFYLNKKNYEFMNQDIIKNISKRDLNILINNIELGKWSSDDTINYLNNITIQDSIKNAQTLTKQLSK